MKKLILDKDYKGIEQALSASLDLANEGIPYDAVNTAKTHPLHRICDGVFSGEYTDEEAVKMAEIFLENGEHINGNGLIEKQDTPLIAAARMHAERVAFFSLEHGDDTNPAGCPGGTALHWAALCGKCKK